MQTHENIVTGSLTLAENAHITGIVGGDVTVLNGAEVLVDGVIGGDLIVETGGKAVLHGVVSGYLVDRGGDIKNLGIVGWGRGSA